MALAGATGKTVTLSDFLTVSGTACGGFRNGGQETTLHNIRTFLLQQNMKLSVIDGCT